MKEEKFCVHDPIPHRSVIAVRDKRGRYSRPYGALIGKTLRVGYYSRQDGLDVIWIVYPNGEYGESIDHSHLYRYFEILYVSSETDLYGDDRPVLLPLS